MLLILVDIDILLEFIEVALHSILYYRKLYPKQIFLKKKIYGTYVHISQYPKLNNYIKNILIFIKRLIQEDKNNLKKLNLLYLNENNIPIEKFIFHFDQLQTNISKADPYFMKIEEILKTLCLNLSILEIYLKPLPTNSSFIINVVTNCAAYIPFAEKSKYDFSWMINDNSKELQNGLILPINSVEMYLILQLYVIEDVKSKINN